MRRLTLALLAISMAILSTGCWHRKGLCRDNCNDDRYYCPNDR